MAQQGNVETLPSDNVLVKWLESKSSIFQIQIVNAKFEELLRNAAQPRHASGNACLKLCHFVEQCRSSVSPTVKGVILSETVCLGLFNFFIEWSEKNQNRSMRQVLELTSSLVALQPDIEASTSVKRAVLKRTLAIVNHRAAQPLVKPAFKSLECFLSKLCLSAQDLIKAYKDEEGLSLISAGDKTLQYSLYWDSFVSGVFDWMAMPDISPAAGKFLVTLFGQLRRAPSDSKLGNIDYTVLWQQWVREGLKKSPAALENVKNHLLSPLFKLDRSGSLAFLGELNEQRSLSSLSGQELDSQSLLRLAAMEVGKKAGLVEEPYTIHVQKPSKISARFIILEEQTLEPLLSHALNTVRSLAFSVLVSSSSSTRPFSDMTLQILRRRLGALHADTDAKFRNEVLSQTKHMIERIRGATAFLVRELHKIRPTGSVSDHTSGNPSKTDELARLDRELQVHMSFIRWYLGFLLGELIPTASYQRHITALRAINLLLKSGLGNQHNQSIQTADHATVWPYSVQFFTTGCMRLLLDLLVDPFEDVRVSATVVLRFASPEDFKTEGCIAYLMDLEEIFKLGKDAQVQIEANGSSTVTSSVPQESLGLLNNFIARASEISKRTGRADYADGVARCYQLLYSILDSTNGRLELVSGLVNELDTKVAIAERDLATAVAEAPVHGILAALSFIWDSINLSTDCRDRETAESYHKRWDEIQQSTYLICKRLWVAVRNILCNDSPEGHLPEDIEDINTIDTKDVLSYSFRATHESSNLMRSMAGKVGYRWHDGSSMLVTNVFIGIGDLTFEQLSTLRHRGAFSTVSLTFARCCQLITKNSSDSCPPNSADPQLLQKWYQGGLSCIYEQVSTTRRSAGIPAIITGILSANSQEPAFEQVMTELKRIARLPAAISEDDKTNLPQVHAMNCLKEIFKSSLLGIRASGHISECLELAADTLSSDIWAMRNCALIFLRSLIDCLFGTHESKAITEAGWDGRSIKLNYDEYPTLPSLLIKLLDAETAISSTPQVATIGVVESVFPALDIIRRAGPPLSQRDEIYRYVSKHLGSKLWHIREIAARTICTMMLHNDWLAPITGLLESARDSANRLHGVLMTVKFTVERRKALNILPTTDDFPKLSAALKLALPHDFLGNGSPEILAALLDVENLIAEALLLESGETWKAILQSPLSPVHLFADGALEDFKILEGVYRKWIQSRGGVGNDLFSNLGNTVARRAVYLTALTNDFTALQEIFLSMDGLGVDIVLAGLEYLPGAWAHNASPTALSEIAKTYQSLLKTSRSSEVRSVALAQLTAILQHNSGEPSIASTISIINSSKNLPSFDFMGLRSSVEIDYKTPSLGNSELAISGFVMLSNHFLQTSGELDSKTYNAHLYAWGRSLSMAGEIANDFDTRFAAAEALAAFYGNLIGKKLISDDYALQSAFALYDSLNDDDDQIRDLSARTISSLFDKSLLPLAARVELAELMCKLHNKQPSYVSNLLCRITGTDVLETSKMEVAFTPLESAEVQIWKAMKNDDSLFVEEEQNLFIDEVRETQLWCEIFEKICIKDLNADEIERIWTSPLQELILWVLHGLETLNKLLETDDGALGWTTKPSVFATCMRVVLCTNAVLSQQNSLFQAVSKNIGEVDQLFKKIATVLQEFVTLGRKRRVHESLMYAIGKI